MRFLKSHFIFRAYYAFLSRSLILAGIMHFQVVVYFSRVLCFSTTQLKIMLLFVRDLFPSGFALSTSVKLFELVGLFGRPAVRHVLVSRQSYLLPLLPIQQ